MIKITIIKIKSENNPSLNIDKTLYKNLKSPKFFQETFELEY